MVPEQESRSRDFVRAKNIAFVSARGTRATSKITRPLLVRPIPYFGRVSCDIHHRAYDCLYAVTSSAHCETHAIYVYTSRERCSWCGSKPTLFPSQSTAVVGGGTSAFYNVPQPEVPCHRECNRVNWRTVADNVSSTNF